MLPSARSGLGPSLLLFAALLGPPAAAQAPQWLQQFGSSTSDLDWFFPSGAISDGAGGVYVSGATMGALSGPNAGSRDAWLARLDGSGNVLWIRQQGGPLADHFVALAGDGAGGVFACGFVGHGWPTDLSDAVVAHYDAGGTLLGQQVFASSSPDYASGIAADGAGGIFVCGVTQGDLFGSLVGGSDVWAAHLDASGALSWSTQFGSGVGEWNPKVSFDPVGGLYLAGSTKGALGGPLQGYQDVWLARLDLGGGIDWIRQYGGVEFAMVQVRGLAVAPSGVFLVGNTNASFAGPHQGAFDAWVAHVDLRGTRRWAHQFGLSEDEEANGVCVDGNGGAFVVGSTDGDLFQPSKGFGDAWVAHFAASGTTLSSEHVGTAKFESAQACTLDGTGALFVFGWTQGALGGQNKGGEDAWIGRY